MTDYDLPPALKATPATAQESILVSLLPIIGVVFVAYLVIGLAMPVLPLHVHDGLGRSTFIVGVVAGSQFVVAVFTRSWTGYYADSRGSKRAVIVGLPVAVLSGLCYLLSLLFLSRPVLSVMILLLGRILLGIGENFIIVLLFSQHGWRQAWLAITLLSVAFIAGRIFFGHLPDRGGVKVAFVCIVIEAIGQALIWLAPQPMLAFVGVILTGLGYSLVYPSFGVEALRRAPAESRGLAMGVLCSLAIAARLLTAPNLKRLPSAELYPDSKVEN